MAQVMNPPYTFFNCTVNPRGGGLGIPTDRDQQSWVFLSNPKNTLALKENPKKYFPKRETLKNTLLTEK